MPVGEEFVNPYRMLAQPGGKPDRRYKTDLSRLEGFVGHLVCQLQAHTPIEVNYARNGNFHNHNHIPGASLKGVLRSVVEFIGKGCMVTKDKNGPWSLCSDRNCCAACDMFGRMVKGKNKPLHRGKVFIVDAVPEQWDKYNQLEIYQGSPREKHRSFYPDSSGECYRKFYLHQPGAQKLSVHHTSDKASFFYPLAPGSVFNFRVDFESLDARQLALLAWSLELEPGLLHKIGRGKAHGLGSVKIRIMEQEVQTAPDRLAGKAPITDWPAKVEREIENIRSNKDLDPLRKVLSWQLAEKLVADKGPIQYPDFNWFKHNSSTELRSIEELFPDPLTPMTDPEAPSLQRDLGKRRQSVGAGISSGPEKPEGFDQALWKLLPSKIRSLVARISVIKHYKSEANQYLEMFRSKDASDDLKRAIVEAFRLLVPKKDVAWLREKFGDRAVVEPPGKKKEQKKPTESEKSPLEGARDVLHELDDYRKIGKKVLRKYWNNLSDSEKTVLAKDITEFCKEHGNPEAVEKFLDLKPYLE